MKTKNVIGLEICSLIKSENFTDGTKCKLFSVHLKVRLLVDLVSLQDLKKVHIQ